MSAKRGRQVGVRGGFKGYSKKVVWEDGAVGVKSQERMAGVMGDEAWGEAQVRLR